jgi:hypothetical protein
VWRVEAWVRRSGRGARIAGWRAEAIVTLLGGDLSSPHQFIRVCKAMAELGRDEEVLLWARRGIAETNGWQVEKLYDLACGVYERRSAPLEVLRLRREQHEGMASASTYSLLRRAADAAGAWDIERDAARLALRERVPCATHCLETAQSLRSARR